MIVGSDIYICKTTSMKTFNELGITEEQHSNYLKLLLFVKANPATPFDISYFTRCEPLGGAIVFDTIQGIYPEGTTRCLAGLGPLAGIEHFVGENWGKYITRVFGCCGDTVIYDFLFNCDHENSLAAATKRLEHFLAEGIPEVDDASELNTFEC